MTSARLIVAAAESAQPATQFTLPAHLEAAAPPESRGLTRDGVRLLVARPGRLEHTRFRDLPDHLAPGDLLVVNTSATLPCALEARRPDGTLAPVHVSSALDTRRWVVEPRRPDASGPDLGATRGEQLSLPGGVQLRLARAYPDPGRSVSRLWQATITPPTPAAAYLTRYGRPISYRYVASRYPLSDYQTVYATHPGSAEMASAGRPFTAELLVRLMTAGIGVAPIVLHAGVSSAEAHEPPSPEWFEVPESTARQVRSTRAAGGRVVAVGTTAVRALETAAAPDGAIKAATGWTGLVMHPGRPAHVVDGLITGLHAPEASHLLMLEAIAGADLVAAAYASALDHSYLWHEFGDSMVFLPEPPRPRPGRRQAGSGARLSA